jgi:hypothetical protein
MHPVYAIALYLALLKLDRLVDDSSKVCHFFVKRTRTLISGLPFTEVSRFAGGGGICMHACLSKCLLLWKMQYIIFFYWRYNPWWVCILQPTNGAIASSRTRFLDHTQRRAAVGRTPVDEWLVRRRDLYLTTHNAVRHIWGFFSSNLPLTVINSLIINTITLYHYISVYLAVCQPINVNGEWLGLVCTAPPVH